MIDIDEATKIVQKAIPDGKIQASVVYNDLYLFQVFNTDPFEEEMDPFFSVHRETGEFRDFSIITDGKTAEVVALFKKAKGLT